MTKQKSDLLELLANDSGCSTVGSPRMVPSQQATQPDTVKLSSIPGWKVLGRQEWLDDFASLQCCCLWVGESCILADCGLDRAAGSSAAERLGVVAEGVTRPNASVELGTYDIGMAVWQDEWCEAYGQTGPSRTSIITKEKQ